VSFFQVLWIAKSHNYEVIKNLLIIVIIVIIVWNPCLQKDINEIEKVQRKITKRIRGFQHLSYSERLRRLRLPTLQTRRLYYDLLECYKIVHGLVRSDCKKMLSLSDFHTRGFQCKLFTKLPPARLNIRKHFFVERVLPQWNALPPVVVQQNSIAAFKLMLRKHLKLVL
jgi:hypothetical protein